MDWGELAPAATYGAFAFFGGIFGFILGQTLERLSKSEDRKRIEAFKINFEFDSNRMKEMATSIQRKADELYASLDRAENTIRSGSNKPAKIDDTLTRLDTEKSDFNNDDAANSSTLGDSENTHQQFVVWTETNKCPACGRTGRAGIRCSNCGTTGCSDGNCKHGGASGVCRVCHKQNTKIRI